jgi:Tol biopolymer transport system component
MKIKRTFVIIYIFILIFVSCTNKSKSNISSYLILDNNIPDSVPKIFAWDKVSKDNRFEQYCSFSPDGREFYFSFTDSAWGKSTIIKVNIEKYYEEEIINITNSNYQSGQFIDWSGKKIYFTSILYSGGIWHTDIYVAKKQFNTWKNPIRLAEPVNSYICEWHPTLTKNGVIYFASERGYDHGIADLYRAIPEKDGSYRVEKLPSAINTEYNETDPLIAPDESFLIFASNRPGGISGKDIYNRPWGYNETDLYISYHKGNNIWSQAKNLGNKINSVFWEFAPSFSPDFKYLFFTRRENFKTISPSKIYWVDMSFIEKLKE